VESVRDSLSQCDSGWGYILEGTAGAPLHTLKSRIRVVAQRIESGAKWDTSTGWRTVWMLVIRIERSVEVEVFLHVDDGLVVLCE